MLLVLLIFQRFQTICYHNAIRLSEFLRTLPLFDSTSRKHKCCLVFSGNRSFPDGKVCLRPQSHTCCYFTGAVYVDGSKIVLKGETVFANNTADYGGTTVNCFI